MKTSKQAKARRRMKRKAKAKQTRQSDQDMVFLSAGGLDEALSLASRFAKEGKFVSVITPWVMDEGLAAFLEGGEA